jgi:hypothetical protein
MSLAEVGKHFMFNHFLKKMDRTMKIPLWVPGADDEMSQFFIHPCLPAPCISFLRDSMFWNSHEVTVHIAS